MSLLFDHAISNFDLSVSSLHVPADGDLKETCDPIPVRPIVEFAQKQPALNDDDGYTLVPLHGTDSAEPSGEHLVFTDHQIRGEIVIYGDGDGDRDVVDVESFSRTPLCRRIRFWHSDYQPEELPDDYDLPVGDSEPPRRSIPTEELFDRLEAYVRSERDATREGAERRAREATPAALYREGESAIPSVETEDATGDPVTFRAEVPDELRSERDDDDDWSYFVPDRFGIYQGNEVVVHGGEDDPCLCGTVETIYGLELRVDVDWTTADNTGVAKSWIERSPEQMGISLRLNPVPSQRELSAIEALRTDPMGGVLAGGRPVTFTNGAAAQTSQLDTDLNQSQALAAELALQADDVFCIHGPPGTGKTRTLVEIVRRAAAAGESVLVCADSNQAVDNIVAGESSPDAPDPASLHAYGQRGAGEFRLDRVNPSQATSRLVREQYSTPTQESQVVAATNNSAASLSDDHFDVVVLDEATQTTCPASCVPLTKANRAVLAGDHKQLPPFSAHETPPDTAFGSSLFEHLYAEGGLFEDVGIQLKTQYRMTREISHFSSREFYDRSLRSGRTVPELPSQDHALEGYDIGGDVKRVDYSYTNATEARLIVHIIGELESVVDLADIGVITPYAAQVTQIEETIAERRQAADADQIVVDTIDSFQGSERDAIIVSLVRSNGEGDLGFLGRDPDGPRRLNVALTRARRFCAVVGDFHTVRYEHPSKDNEFYRRFYRHFDETGRLRKIDPDLLSSVV